jgi:hypothetical protein
MKDRQSQQGGDGAQMVQVAGDLIQRGLSLAEAIAVADLQARRVVSEEFAKGDALAMSRIEVLNEKVIRALDGIERLTAFADPAFQVSLKRAQIGAACSEEESDYEILAQLLTDRVVRGDERQVRAGLDAAIGIVDRIDVSALAGLTVLQAAMQFRPIAGPLVVGLGTMDRLHGQLITSDLPTGSDWLDHLDILDAVRASQIGSLKRFEQFYPEFMPGYVAPGIEANSEAETAALAALEPVRPHIPIVDHELKPGFRRIAYCDLELFEVALKAAGAPEADVTAAVGIARDAYGLGQQDAALIDGFMAELDKFPHLKLLHEWWNGISFGVQVTAVGKVLARANANRCDVLEMLPPLE